MTRMKTDTELRRIIKRKIEPYGVVLNGLYRNIQTSVDVELDERDHLKEKEWNEMEDKIRAIEGVVINDIFYRGG